jgi:multidrug efflux system membrane fusion protein
VNARLLLDTQHGVILIPTPAIQRNSQSAFVYVIKPDQTASMRTVQVGTTDGNITAVQGVQSGEVVAVDGFDKLQNGVKVTRKTQNPSGGNSSDDGDGSSNGDQAP